MMITTYILDDELFAADILKHYITKTPGLELQGLSTDALQALDHISADPPMLLFLDIDMPRLNGLDLGRLIRGKTALIFTSSHRNFGPEAFDLNAVDYLLKPVAYERFLDAVQKARTSLSVNRLPKNHDLVSFFVKTDIKGKMMRVIVKDIIYISNDHNYVQIHLTNGRIKAYLTITELLEELPAAMFCRPHRSYIVNIDTIKSVEPGLMRLSNEAVIDIGPTYRDALLLRLNSRIITSHR